MNGWPECAEDEEMLTIRPQPASSMSGSTAWVQWNTPLRLTSMTFCQTAKSSRAKPLPDRGQRAVHLGPVGDVGHLAEGRAGRVHLTRGVQVDGGDVAAVGG